MHNSEQRPTKETRHSSTAKIGLLGLGVTVGACILMLGSLSGQAIDDAKLAPAPMTGANLSALHAAIPASSGQESAPSF